MATTSKLSDLMTMDAIARTVHMNRQRVKDMCIKAGIAIRWGKLAHCGSLWVLPPLPAASCENRRGEQE